MSIFKLILEAYTKSIKLLVKKPLVTLLLAFVSLVNIRLSFAMTRFEQNGLGYDFLLIFSRLFALTLSVYFYWLIFNSENINTFSLGEWMGKYYLRSLLQYVGGFFLFFPFYSVLRLTFGEDGLAVKPGHDILMISMSVWVFIAMDLAVLWLCFRNDGFFQNAKNSIADAFRNFGYYLILRLLSIALAYLTHLTFSTFAVSTTGLLCGLTILVSVLSSANWIALVFGFLELRKREQLPIVNLQS
ncbi:MAG: hypothetical protein HY867_20175 [Chloroflexi bacterium]|nr:hypothetical protein [Chloroflexota bacterium]